MSNRPTSCAESAIYSLHNVQECRSALWVKKQDTLLMSYLSETLIDLKKILSLLDSVQNLLQNENYFPLYLKDVAALPCKTVMFQKSHEF